MKHLFLSTLIFAGLAASGWSQIATVDGVGGAATGDPRYPTSYATINLALTDVRLGANDVAPGNTIRVTAPVVTETAGLTFNTTESLTVESTVPGGSHIKLKESGIGIAGASCAMVVVQRTDKTISFRDLIFTPTDGAAGPVNARALQVYNASADVVNSVLNVERCYFTAIRPTGHPNAGQPILNPLVHAASADTNAARLAELRVFDGGGANNAIELRQNSAPVAGSGVTYNFIDSVITHNLLTATAAKGGGIVVTRNGYLTLNMSGCVISFNSGSGIRTAVAAAAPTTMIWNIDGTPQRPNIFYKNGWVEDSANAARSEGLYMDAGQLNIDHSYFVGNYQDGIEKQNRGDVVITNTYSAQNHSDLDATAGTAPDAANVANLKLVFADATVESINLTSVTLFNSLAATNDLAILWGQSNANTLTANNVIYAGAGDQGALLDDATGGAAFYNEVNSAVVQAGPHAMESPYIGIGASITPTTTFRVTADPEFASTTFAPVWNGISAPITGLADYLSVRSSAYLASREPGAAEVTGANPISSTNASVQDYMLY